MYEIVLGVMLFTAIVMALVGVVLMVRSRLVATGAVELIVNDDAPKTVAVGTQLLDALVELGVHLPAGCGGKGTCGQCRVVVLEGGGAIMPIEQARITKREAKQGTRLACQIPVRRDMSVRVPDEIFGVQEWQCTVRSNSNVATMIKELVLELPAGEEINFRAGSYVQITAPAYSTRFDDFDVGADYKDEWDRLELWRHTSTSNREETRAYSMASSPDETHTIMLNVRIAIPPPGAPGDVPPGIVSSFLFSLKPGDTVKVSGPFGHFFAADTQNEMIFVGGGAGMAPMRSHIFDQLKRLQTDRKISFWYGARSKRELFYVKDFDLLEKEHENFKWVVSLSDERADERWMGKTGFIHDVLFEEYLKDHPAPETCEYYVCGPPMMLRAVLKMLDNLGVDAECIFYDDFGG
ncbi:MAG: NADH:ubiquinone reductase (Na(+)-transporting) subunit F [Hyphomicrobiales bacterium]|nr:NADH:ubiquinone reductase (Na(+)-transporting) subunit F [Hyphomicrobiales bacterium]